ncbi:hypothetical protein BKA82DRAFT_4015922 [Pisolithus tinctorius]|nr:hypothetical protein BKA82DRAFT_4015922 [Pisolithus tinctorius]
MKKQECFSFGTSLMALMSIVSVINQQLVCIILDGLVAITGSNNGQVMLWDIRSGKLTQSLRHGKALCAVQVVNQRNSQYYSSQAGSHYIVSGSSDPADSADTPLLQIWSTKNTDQHSAALHWQHSDVSGKWLLQKKGEMA